jgi:hypothetical protein
MKSCEVSELILLRPAVARWLPPSHARAGGSGLKISASHPYRDGALRL